MAYMSLAGQWVARTINIPDPDTGKVHQYDQRFTLYRYKVNCCAADATPLKAMILIDRESKIPLPADNDVRNAWAMVNRAVITFLPPAQGGGGVGTPALILESQERPRLPPGPAAPGAAGPHPVRILSRRPAPPIRAALWHGPNFRACAKCRVISGRGFRWTKLASPFVRVWNYAGNTAGYPGQVLFCVMGIMLVIGVLTWLGQQEVTRSRPTRRHRPQPGP